MSNVETLYSFRIVLFLSANPSVHMRIWYVETAYIVIWRITFYMYLFSGVFFLFVFFVQNIMSIWLRSFIQFVHKMSSAIAKVVKSDCASEYNRCNKSWGALFGWYKVYCRMLNARGHVSLWFGYVWRSWCFNFVSVMSEVLFLFASIIFREFYFRD